MKKILLIIAIILAIFQLVAISANLFADGFESGDLTAWSSSATDGGNLSAATAAKLHGNYGLSCLINDATRLYVQDTTPDDEKRYRARFYYDPNGWTLVGAEVILLQGNNNANSPTFYVIANTAGYKICAKVIKDSGDVYTSSYEISDAPHCIEIDWKASSAALANDGFLELIIDGISKETLANLDNDTKAVGLVYLGARYQGATSTGTFFLDDFQSNNDGSAIGMLGDNAIMFGINF